MSGGLRRGLASVLLVTVAVTVDIAARPRYGGTLRVAVEGVIRGLDPSTVAATAADVSAARQILPLVFETLLTVNPKGGLAPGLAIAWEGDATANRWRLALRHGVRLHDGTVLDAAQVAAVLRAGHPAWRISAGADAVTIESGEAATSGPRRDAVLWALADPRSAIAVGRPAGLWIGTGPFKVDRLEPGRLTLAANDAHWAGRPFVDTVQVAMDRSPAARRADLEAGRLDLASAEPTDVRRLVQRQIRVATSRPIDLVALVFEGHRTSDTHDALRRLLAAAVDRSALARVVLQGQGEPATSVLPPWLSGYALESAAFSGRAAMKTAVTALPTSQRALTVRVMPGDALGQLLAERIAVDAREAGFTLAVQVPRNGLAPRVDLRLVRVPIESTSPERALAAAMTLLGPRIVAVTSRAAPLPGAPLETVYRAERALVEGHVLVPLAHVPEIVAMGPGVETWTASPIESSGAWNLAQMWLRADAAAAP